MKPTVLTASLMLSSLMSAPLVAAQTELHEIDLLRPIASGTRYHVEGTGALDMQMKVTTLLVLGFSQEDRYGIDYAADVTVDEVDTTGNLLRETHRIERFVKTGTGLFGLGREEMLAAGVLLTIDHRKDRETFTVPGRQLDAETRAALDVHFGNVSSGGHKIIYEADVSGEIATAGEPVQERHVIRICEKHGVGFLGLGRDILLQPGERLLVTRERGRVRFETQPTPPPDTTVAALEILFGGMSDPRSDAIYMPSSPQRVGATWPVDFSRISGEQPDEIADVIDQAEGHATLAGLEQVDGQRCLRLTGEWQVSELGKSIEIPENLEVDHAQMRSVVSALYPVDSRLQPIARAAEFRAEFDVGGQPEGAGGPHVRARGHVEQKTDLRYRPL